MMTNNLILTAEEQAKIYLQNDATPYGGKAFVDETLNDFCEDFERSNNQSDFADEVNSHADKINDETLTEEDASYLSEVSTNEKSKHYSTSTK